jgi:hypothetical protein
VLLGDIKRVGRGLGVARSCCKGHGYQYYGVSHCSL